MKNGTIVLIKKTVTLLALVMLFACQQKTEEHDLKNIPHNEETKPDTTQHKSITPDSKGVTPSDSLKNAADTIQRVEHVPLMNYRYFRRTFTLHRGSYTV